MPKFDVEVAAMAPVYVTLRVSAKDTADARRKARDRALNGRIRWRLNRDNLACSSDVHVVGTEEAR